MWSQRQATNLMKRWKESHPCADCHFYFHYFQMEFDHNPSLGKVVNLGTDGKKLSEIELRREMAKCTAVCSNCHKMRTWHRLCGLRLGAPPSQSRGRHLSPGASLTPWTRVDTPAKTERVQGRSSDFATGPLQPRQDSRVLTMPGIPDRPSY